MRHLVWFDVGYDGCMFWMVVHDVVLHFCVVAEVQLAVGAVVGDGVHGHDRVIP
jgi:hypothetical protein